VSCADEAIDYLRQTIDELPAGVGVDAPLWWSSGKSGDRAADRWLREKYRSSRVVVQPANCLRGAALVQGATFVRRLRETFGDVPVTEVHPGVLVNHAFKGAAAFERKLQIRLAGNEHERDAIVAAVAARESFTGRWTHDLSTNRLSCEEDPKRYWLAPVSYYWPEH
jgi:predicted nuclease with RNAse H fold